MASIARHPYEETPKLSSEVILIWLGFPANVFRRTRGQFQGETF